MRTTVNGVDVGPLVNAELDRRYPDRAKMRPTDPAGFREAWDVVERLWAGTVERARRLDPELLHASVDGEWSFIETLRHLVFATDAWIRRAILGDPAPWDPLDLPWDEMPDTPGVPRDRDARPSLDEVLELRRDRMATRSQVVDGLTDESLAAHTEPVEGPGWPQPRSLPGARCLLTILNEEWEHRLYAETPLELFFDLVFVFALTQVTALMADDLTGHGCGPRRCWCSPCCGGAGSATRGSATWCAPTRASPASAMFGAMAALFVAALTIPEAFDDLPGGLSGPVVFAVCYFAVRLPHLAMFWAMRPGRRPACAASC